MWNCSTIMTRNKLLSNRTANLATKDVYLKSSTALVLSQKLFQTKTLSIHEYSGRKKIIERKNWNSILTSGNYQNFDYIKEEKISSEYLPIRKFHTFLVKYCVDTKKNALYSKTTTSESKSSKLLIKDVLKEDSFTEKNEILREDKISNKIKSFKPIDTKESKYIKYIEKMYPDPKEAVHNIYQTVKQVDKSTEFKFDFFVEKKFWTCTLTVSWPKKLLFSAVSDHKNKAARMVSLKCLDWLVTNKKIKKRTPIMYSREEIENILKAPVPLSVEEETLNSVEILLDKYKNKIQTIVESDDNTLHFERKKLEESVIIDPVGNTHSVYRNESILIKRNELLRDRLENCQKRHSSNNLPIMEFREKIIEQVENNNILVIKGGTGCGKTTQVPQFIMDSFIKRGKATDCNMIVSQPRRISAISLAERLASEREERLGDVVGYQVRLNQVFPNTPGGILFCTAGILLRKIYSNPTLEGCSHIIIDEAHERTINTDMLLALLKHAVKKRPTLKVIIMSATINAELFQNYFNCNVIEVPGRLYPVEMNFLEDIDQLNLEKKRKWDTDFGSHDNSEIAVDIPKMASLISYITCNKPPGAILCFLPGWGEIAKMKKYLELYCFTLSGKIMIVPIHSKVPYLDQRKIFSTPPPGLRKIVLATDIAETGITVSDVVYVIDSCIQKQVRWDRERNFAIIESQWASQANINQRKGRAGRVQPGISYHFITRKKFTELYKYPLPEIMRLSLEKTVLDVKSYSGEKAEDFLGSFPEPPPSKTIRQAVEDLIQLGALDADENLTPLGKRIALFTLTPQLSKAVILASIFRCISPIMTIASLMSDEIEIFSGILEHRTAIRNVKTLFHPMSDHLSIAWLFQQWHTLNFYNKMESQEFATKSYLNQDKMQILSKVREIDANNLYSVKMISDVSVLNDLSAEENEYSGSDELCRAVLLGGVDFILFKRDFNFRQGKLKKGTLSFIKHDGDYATITSDSVNFNRKSWQSPFIVYVHRTHSEERRTSLIRDTSIVSPLTVFLFNQGEIIRNSYNPQSNQNDTDSNNNENPLVLFTVKKRKNIRLVCDEHTADLLLKFRNVIWSVVRYMVANYGVKSDDEFEKVDEFKAEMLRVLVNMLKGTSETKFDTEFEDPYEEPSESDTQNIEHIE